MIDSCDFNYNFLFYNSKNILVYKIIYYRKKIKEEINH